MDTATLPPADPEEHLSSLLECPICFSPYDNIFKTPLQLPCSHTFCMECLARLCLFLKKSQEFPCPLCRNLACVPPQGVPKIQPNRDIVARFPPEMQTLQDVWVEGYKLCWMKKKDSLEGKGSLVTIHLLSNGRENPTGQGGLIPVERNGCRAFYGSVWGFGFTVFAIAIILFTVLFVPIYIFNK